LRLDEFFQFLLVFESEGSGLIEVVGDLGKARVSGVTASDVQLNLFLLDISVGLHG